MRFPIKFPTLVGILFLAIFVGGFAYFFERVIRLPSQASVSSTPTSVEITNVSDTSFTVSWITESAATGAIRVGSESIRSQVIFDERDTTGKLGKNTTHSVTFRSGDPETLYEITILSGGKPYTQNGKPYKIQTGPLLGDITSAFEPAYGSVVTPNGQPAQAAIVYLTLLDGQKMSTLVTESGSWLIPLNLVRNEDLSAYLPFQERVTEQLVVRFENGESFATTDTLNDSPTPEMQIGKTYDFRKQQANAQLGAVAGTSTTNIVSLNKPIEGASIATTLPLIQGTGITGKRVSIILGITKPTGGTVVVGQDGIWRYTPSAPLSPGLQSVTMTTEDQSGKSVAITHAFEILKSGTQVLGDATPSATLTPSLTPTPTSTLAGEQMPESGNSLPLLLLLIMGSGLLIVGLTYRTYLL